jgi:hypothetical protein
MIQGENNVRRLSTSNMTYLGLVAVLVIVCAMAVFVPTGYIPSVQAAMFTWPVVIILAVLGFIGLWLTRRTGFPDLWDAYISNKQRLLIPTLLGLGTGAILVLLDLIQPVGEIHIPFPFSIPYYAYAAIASEILFRLFPIPLFVWLFSSLLLKHRWQEQIFWGVAIVLSLPEPLAQIGVTYQMGMLDQPILTLLLATVIFGANLISAYLFRKSGFLAPLAMRLSIYLVWHVIYGGWHL